MSRHRYAMCMICYGDVYATSLDNVHCLWDDEGWSGRPICFGCYCILLVLRPKKLDVPIVRPIPIKIGLEKWI